MVGRGFRAAMTSLYGTSDPEQQMEMFGRSGTLFATVSLNASSFSAVQWRLFVESDGRAASPARTRDARSPSTPRSTCGTVRTGG